MYSTGESYDPELAALQKQGKASESVMVTQSPRALFPSPVMAAAAALKQPSGQTMKVRIVAPYRCCHEGESYVGGDAVTVPVEIADHWLKNKWAEPTPARSKPASQKGES